MYTLFYASQDAVDEPWTVYSEDYASIGDFEPIEGSRKVVSRNHTEAEAHAAADYHQRQSYGKRRQEQQDAEA